MRVSTRAYVDRPKLNATRKHPNFPEQPYRKSFEVYP